MFTSLLLRSFTFLLLSCGGRGPNCPHTAKYDAPPRPTSCETRK